MSGIVKGIGKLAGGAVNLVKGIPGLGTAATVASAIPAVLGSSKKGSQSNQALEAQLQALAQAARVANAEIASRTPLRRSAESGLASLVARGPAPPSGLAARLRETRNPFARRFAPPAAPGVGAPALPPELVTRLRALVQAAGQGQG